MRTTLCRVALLAMMASAAVPAGAQAASGPIALTLPTTGTFAKGGSFTGTISINRFEQRGNEIVAIGFVRGVLSQGNRTLGTGVAGEVAWPVALRSGGQLVVRGHALATARPVQIAWSPGARSPVRMLQVQADSCPVLDVALGPVNVNLLGFQVALSAVTLNLDGVMGTPLGDLVCAVSDLLGNVAGLVNLLNSLLGLLTGLLGGLTGGLG
jgi:hypothetical protein